MHSLSLIPASAALFLVLAGGLLMATAVAALRLPWLARGPAELRADRLLLAILCPLLAAAAITALVVATLVDHLLEFHHMPHLCLDHTMGSAVARLAVFGFEGASLAALLVVGRQVVQSVRLFRQACRAAETASSTSLRATEAASRAGERLGVTLAGLHEVDLPHPTAFVLGVARPRCVLARCLVERLSAAELEAVLAHEMAHLLRGDVAARRLVFACGRLFGFLPPVRALLEAWEAAAEMAADDLAVARTGRRLELAGALLQAARCQPVALPALLGGPAGLLVTRVERLLGQPEPAARLVWRRWASIIVAATLAGGLVQAVVYSPMLPSLHCFVENLVRAL